MYANMGSTGVEIQVVLHRSQKYEFYISRSTGVEIQVVLHLLKFRT